MRSKKMGTLLIILLLSALSGVGCTKKCADDKTGQTSTASSNDKCESDDSSTDSDPVISVIASGFYGKGVVVDSQNNVYACEYSADKIWKISADGAVSEFLNSVPCYLMTIDASDNLYIAPWAGGTLRKVSPAGSASVIGTIDDSPAGLAIDSNGNIYFSVYSATNANRIQKITQSGVVSIFAGSGSAGYQDGSGTAAMFDHPQGIAIDKSDNLFVVDSQNSRIRKISPAGDVSSYSGSGTRGVLDGSSSIAQFSFRLPGAQETGLAITQTGILFVGQAYGIGYLRSISTDGTVGTFCGNGSDSSAAVTGPCSTSPFYQSGQLATGPDDAIYYADGYGNIVKIKPP